jgi:hypothetical protein
MSIKDKGINHIILQPNLSIAFAKVPLTNAFNNTDKSNIEITNSTCLDVFFLK